MARVYVTRDWFPEAQRPLHQRHDVRMWTGPDTPSRDVLLSEVREIDGLISIGSDDIDADVITAGRRLRVISQFGDGLEHVDLDEATRRRIPVGHTPDVLSETTADLAFGLLLAAARRIVEGQAFARDGRWKAHAHLDLPGVDVNNKTLGIVGLGRIGSHVAKRARAFNMRVLYHSRTRHVQVESLLTATYQASLHEMLPQCDFVVLTAPHTPDTRNIIGREEFALMKPTSILVNVARGALVDEKALYDALHTGQILRAALDVTSIEPLPLDSPLFSLDNILVMPHIGSAVPSTRERMMTMAVEQMLLALDGKRIPNCANPGVYKHVEVADVSAVHGVQRSPITPPGHLRGQ